MSVFDMLSVLRQPADHVEFGLGVWMEYSEF